MAEFAVVGKGVERKEGPAKVSGEFIFPTDVKVPGMVVGKILRSPHAHARIKTIDISEAEKIEGVLAVVSDRNLPVKSIVWGQDKQDETIFATDKVRYIGDEVAAVAAIDEASADKALAAIKVDYEILPAYTDYETCIEEASAGGGELIHKANAGNIAQEAHNVRGDPDAGFAGADLTFEGEYETSRIHQAYLEGNVAVAHFKKDGSLDIWASTQWPSRHREDVANILGLEITRVRVRQSHVGGGFGGKFCPKLSLVASVLSMKCGRPVRVANSLKDDFESATPFGASHIKVKTGLKKDGTVVARAVKTLMDNGAYSSSGLSCMYVSITRANNVYRCPNVREDGWSPYTNLLKTGAYRGYGNQALSFAMEREMERIARAIDMDPAEFRLKNATQTGDVTVDGYKVASCGLAGTIRWAAKASDYGHRRPAEGHIHYGKGMASGIHVSGNTISYKHWDASGAVVRINQDGRVELYTPEPDIGQGSNTVLAQIAAEELGVPYEDIHVHETDTDLAPFGVGAVGSHVTLVGGNGAKAAAANARKMLAETAAAMLGCEPRDVEIRDGRVYRKAGAKVVASGAATTAATTGATAGATAGAQISGGQGFPDELTVAQVANQYYIDHFMPLTATGSWRSVGAVDPVTKMNSPSSAYSFATHVAEVAVDMETGLVRVVNYWASHDIGRVINLKAAQGQIEGGVVQGIGFALTERMIFDNGRVVNPDYLDYKMPVALDAPHIHTHFVESNDPYGPFGAKGIGELAFVPVAGAVANAVADATGLDVAHLPITPMYLLRLMKEKQSR